MRVRRTCIGLLLGATLALGAAVPASAAEEEVIVPPANSAVNQYTEAFPTAGGDREAHNQKGRDVSAGKVIGASNARKLDQHGAAGKATARFAADTAPNPIASNPQSAGHPAEVVVTTDQGNGAAKGGAGGTAGGTGVGQNDKTAPNPATGSAPAQTAHAAPADGSSGLSEVLSRATGTSSGDGMGIFLPLLILAAIAWAIAYTVRQRRPVS